jgi:DNA-binding response OmpR family regulator
MTATEKLVLIIDDDDGIRELLSFLIKKEGFRVETAVDGEDGFHKAEKLAPDLIVLDLMLPRYGGFELLRQLQSTPLSRVPIVVVTGRYTDRSTADMIRQESNVVEFLEKPVKTAQLAAVLQRLLRPSGAEKA